MNKIRKKIKIRKLQAEWILADAELRSFDLLTDYKYRDDYPIGTVIIKWPAKEMSRIYGNV